MMDVEELEAKNKPAIRVTFQRHPANNHQINLNAQMIVPTQES